jgi:EmrB/QacA subfamily drug resistance transporter
MTTISHPRRWLILALILVAECMDLLDSTIVNVAAPTIRTDLHASAADLQWVIGGYALAFAAGLIAGGRLGDIYGRKRLFVVGASGFVAASVACAFAVNPGMLIGCRLAQGAAAALLIPQGLGVIRDIFAADELGSAFAVFGPVIGLSAVLGPILGGALIDADAFGTGWRLIFFVNLPLGLIAAVGAARLMPESRAEQPTRLDLVGTGLAALGMGLLVYPLIQGQQAGWPAWTYLMGAGSAVSFAALVGWSRRLRRRGRDPLVEASVFGHRAYSVGLASVVVFFAGMIGTLLVLTLFLQFGEHFTAIHAGLTLAPFALGSATGATLAATVLGPRLGRGVLQVAAVFLTAGAWWLRDVISVHGLATSSTDLIPPQLVLGIGIGMLISPLFGFILASVTDVEVGSASGVLNATQQLAGAVGVAVIGTVFFHMLGQAGFVAAVNRCLLIELATAPVLFVLTLMLPARPRESEVAPRPDSSEPDGDGGLLVAAGRLGVLEPLPGSGDEHPGHEAHGQYADQGPAERRRTETDVLQARRQDHERDCRPDVTVGRPRGQQ